METVEGISAAEAVLLVEEQMSVLAGQIRANTRDAALAVDPSLQPFGLKLLRMIMRCGPTHASVAAETLCVDRSAISRQAKQLEELNLITIQADPADGRARFLALTPLGAERLGAAISSHHVLMNERMNSWTPDELLVFADYLARLNGSRE